MPIFPGRAALLAAAMLALPLGAQEPPRDTTQRLATRFFDSEAPVEFTLVANYDRLRRDPLEDPPWRAATIAIADSGGDRTIPLRVRGRGIWRRKNCQNPPLRLNFAREAVRGTVFEGLDRPKLVHYCQDTERAEQYILQEFQLYRIYRLFTPLSHRVRLARIAYVDSGETRPRTRRWAFLLEEPDAMAERNGGAMIEVALAGPELDERTRVTMGVFQYLIANTDWSTGGLHNVEIFQKDFVFYPVPYDFDYAGAVNAHYAGVAPNIPIRSIRQRIYRGHCGSDSTFAAVFEEFRRQREAIYALYRDEIGALMDRNVVKRTLDYFDDFYEVINDPRKARRQIVEACLEAQ